MERKKIDCFIDCVSPYSFYAFSYLRKNRQALSDAGVDVEFFPVFLGGINVATGNKPPWTLPAKAAYSQYDMQRAQAYFGLRFEVPAFFPILSLLPQRSLLYTKQHHPELYEQLFEVFFEALWIKHVDISQPQHLLAATQQVFDAAESRAIVKAADTQEIKDALNKSTLKAVEEMGAFGCPWFWVSNGKGRAEPFFGSDRFHYMWDFLDVPHHDLELCPANAKL